MRSIASLLITLVAAGSLPLAGMAHATAPPPTAAAERSPPCKRFGAAMVDCRARRLTRVPGSAGLGPDATELDLSANRIAALAPGDLAGLPLLRGLNLSENGLRTVRSGTFRSLVAVRTLNLSGNSIGSLEEGAFGGLVGLATLDLSRNNLVALPEVTFLDQASLRELSLAFNDLARVPSAALAPLRNLRSLDLSLNPFLGHDFQLGEGFKSMERLERLVLWALNLRCLHNGSFSALESLRTLSVLDLSANDVRSVSEGAFRPLQGLRHLSLRDTYYSPGWLPPGLLSLDLAGVLPSVVPHGILTGRAVRLLSRHLPNLTSLSLARTEMRAIRSSAMASMGGLRRLDLSRNALTLLSLSDRSFDGLTGLEDLELSDNRLEDVPAAALSAFNRTDSLRRLSLAGNALFRLSDDAFSSLPFLETLDLARNQQLWHLGDSLDALPRLERLDLADNQLFRFPPLGWAKPLPSLRVLDLSGNQGGEYETGARGLDRLAPGLRELYAGRIGDPLSLALVLNCTALVGLDVSSSGIDESSFHDASGFGWASLTLPALQTLNLAGNLITSLSADAFLGSPKLRRLDASRNALAAVDARMLAGLAELESVDLSFNELTNVSALSPFLPSLRSAALSNNKISSVDVALFADGRQPALEIVDLSHNPYSCECDVRDYLRWLLEDTRVYLRSPSYYACNSPKDLQGRLIADLVLDSCVSRLALYLGTGTASVTILVVLLVALCVRYHWHLRYKVFLVFRRGGLPWNGRRGDDGGDDNADAEDRGQGGPANNNPPQFDAFVSFNDSERAWVLRELIPHLEGDGPEGTGPAGGPPFRLCVVDRDLPAGESRADAIAEAIQSSRKTLFVLSPDFLESEWCYYEMQTAHQRLFREGKDVLVLVLVEDIPDHKMTVLLRQTLCRKDYLKWPRDPLGQRLFWDRLREELKVSSTVNRQLDV